MQDGPDTYCFTGKQLRAMAQLMRRVGLVLWQQALLFPTHITKLGTLRLDDLSSPADGPEVRGLAAVAAVLPSHRQRISGSLPRGRERRALIRLKPSRCAPQHDVEHWRRILRRLHCREEQLHKIVAGHQRYIARMAPVLEERAGERLWARVGARERFPAPAGCLLAGRRPSSG